jgi:hypothetical protein
MGLVGTQNWFHVPIAAPVILADTRAKLVRVFAMFRPGSQAAIDADQAGLAGCNVTDVRVWDEPNRIRHRSIFSSAWSWRCTFPLPRTSP